MENSLVVLHLKGSNKLQCYLVMNPIKLFWYLIHVEWTVRNGNSISVNITDEHNWKQLEQCLLLLLLVKFGICLFDIGWWKQYTYIVNKNNIYLHQTVFSFEAGNRRISPAIAIKSPAMNFPSMD
jgi:hypothetical protein